MGDVVGSILPIAGSVVGNMVLPGIGGQIGGALGGMAGKAIGGGDSGGGSSGGGSPSSGVAQNSITQDLISQGVKPVGTADQAYISMQKRNMVESQKANRRQKLGAYQPIGQQQAVGQAVGAQPFSQQQFHANWAQKLATFYSSDPDKEEQA